MLAGLVGLDSGNSVCDGSIDGEQWCGWGSCWGFIVLVVVVLFGLMRW